jgi:hypothetical protein
VPYSRVTEVIDALLSMVARKVMLSGKLSVGWSSVTLNDEPADTPSGVKRAKVMSSRLEVRERSEFLIRIYPPKFENEISLS